VPRCDPVFLAGIARPLRNPQPDSHGGDRGPGRAPAIGLTLFHNQQVTGNWTTHPYALSRYEYGIPTSFTFQPKGRPHRDLTPQQQLDYLAQADLHGTAPTLSALTSSASAETCASTVFLSHSALSGAAVLLLQNARCPLRLGASCAPRVRTGDQFYPISSPLHRRRDLPVRPDRRDRARTAEPVQRARIACRPARRAIAHLPMSGALLFLVWPAPCSTQDFAAAAIRFETWDAINYGDPMGASPSPTNSRRRPEHIWSSSATGRSIASKSGSSMLPTLTRRASSGLAIWVRMKMRTAPILPRPHGLAARTRRAAAASEPLSDRLLLRHPGVALVIGTCHPLTAIAP